MAERRNLAGLTFGRLIAVEPVDSNKLGLVRWRCICSCGKEVIVVGAHLTSGNTKSCGCIRSADDLTGQKFGRWTVVRRSDKEVIKGHIYYYCQCDCGRCKDVYGPSLVRGKSRSCGCLNSELAHNRMIDLSGLKFNRLTAIECAGLNSQGNYAWKCRCDCGKETIVSSDNLRRNHVTSCGCLGRENSSKARTKDITGMKFGRLTALYVSGKYRHQNVWHCSCECGRESDVPIANLTSGGTKSCGCMIHDVLIARNTTHGMTGTPEYNHARTQQRRERKKKLDTKWTYEMRKALKEMFPQCVYCGSTDNLEVDHVIPLSKGRGLEPGNATILCQHHNGVKKDKPLEKLPEDMRRAIEESAAKFKEYWYSLHPEELPALDPVPK